MLALLLILAAQSGPDRSYALVDDLEPAARYSAERGGLALLVWKGDRTVLERYDNGAKAQDRNNAFSITKAVWGLATAAAVEDGLLSWDERVSSTLTEWREDPVRRTIDLRQLLSMTSGLDPGYTVIDDPNTADKLSAATGLQAIAEPGFTFNYGPGNMAALGELLRRKLKPKGLTPMRFLSARILTPLGLSGLPWSTDKAGNPMMAAGSVMSARELLAVGHAYLDGRSLSGKRVIKTSSLGPLTIPSSANGMFGLTLWLNRGAFEEDAVEVDVEQALGLTGFAGWKTGCFSRSAPADVLVLLGSYNQRVYVVPSLDLVVVRQGKTMELKDAEFMRLLFEERPAELVMY